MCVSFYYYYNKSHMLFFSRKNLKIDNSYEIKTTKLIWNDPCNNIFFTGDTNYNKKSYPFQALKVIFEEWRAVVMRHMDNRLIFKVNHVACGNQSVVFNIEFDRDVFFSATIEYVFIKNLWDTLKYIFPHYKELYVFYDHNPFNFKFIGYYFNDLMNESNDALKNEQLERKDCIWNNNMTFVACMHSTKGNKIGAIYEKNIYQKANIYKQVFLIPDTMPNANNYYSAILQKINRNSCNELCFVSFFTSEYPIVSVFFSDNEDFLHDIELPSIASNKSKRKVSDNMIIMYRALKQYCQKNNIVFLVPAARYKVCYSYILGPSMAIEIGTPNDKDPVVSGVVSLINSLVSKED